MSKRYYQNNTTHYLHDIIIDAIQTITRLYICQVLYPDEMEETYVDKWGREFPLAYKRYILADISNDSNSGFKRRQGEINFSNYALPFTAYNFGDIEENTDYVNHFAKSYHYFSRKYSTNIAVRPLKFEIPMISFFATPDDFYIAQSFLRDQAMSSTRLYAPITIDGETENFPFDVDFEIASGQYAFAHEEHRSVGKIYDLIHNVTVSFQDVSISMVDVNPVDDIFMDFRSFLDREEDFHFEETLQSYEPPTIQSVVPTDESVDVAIDSDIVITFDLEMIEDEFRDNLSVSPYFEYRISMDDTCKIFTIITFLDLDNSTKYTITIGKDVLSANEQEMEEDYEFSFTTIA